MLPFFFCIDLQVRTLFLHWLPCVLRMSRPGQKTERKATTMNSKMRDIEMKERSSRSLLANVLDIDDDFRQHSCTLSSVGSGMALSMGVPAGYPRVVTTPSAVLGPNQGILLDFFVVENLFDSHKAAIKFRRIAISHVGEVLIFDSTH